MIKKNLNQAMKNKKMVYSVTTVAVLVVLGAVIIGISHKSKPVTSKTIAQIKQQPAMIAGALTDFDQQSQQTSLEQQQVAISSIKEQVKSLKRQLATYKSEAQNGGQGTRALQQQLMQMKMEEEERLANKKGKGQPTNMPRQISMSTFTFSYHNASFDIKNPKTYVPASTYVGGLLLQGADANASVNGQGATQPILIKLTDNGTLPNGDHSHLKNCRVLASIYGDISSERGEVRLTNLSCTRKDGSILDTPVRGYVSFHGKEGIAGKPVMRNGPIIFWAGLSGLFSGFGNALSQSNQTVTTTPLGSMSTLDSGKVWSNAGAQGLGSAMDRLSSYYIKRADQYHPIIEVGSGNKVTVVFQKGFYLKDGHSDSALKAQVDQAVTTSTDGLVNAPNQKELANLKIPQSVIDKAKSGQLGQDML